MGALTSDDRAGRTDLVLAPDNCIQKLRTSQANTYPDNYALPDQIALVSWNIYKAQGENLTRDLAQLNSQADIVLLQEALLNHELVGLKPYWRFAPGYSDGTLQSGVLTLSRWPATVHCHFVHQEPWLRTPKATNVVEYVISDGRRLLAINLHAINFSLGLADYRQQLDDVIAIIQQHQGPVVFAGDLNSWSLRRGKLLDERLQSAGLVSADFHHDNRTRFWGQPLDHVWVRGIDISDTEVPTYSSSDHNPLLVNVDLSPVNKPTPATLASNALAKNALAKIGTVTPETLPDVLNVIEH
ncbi:endonuclease/exonuclease/phosphatase family protein [Aestuariicella hydrocarbonica]|uniref:Endonuclease/exonuclease/phosphatase family protein n=1 Tax=Pseudomaricurvus hydrocarbonicus TaxID=1470433 RepID=A0A9E5JVV0_9GAMM|nr:endonuclease/exonuclease/phosphatase family protein [Aestuariicella hydrocarbonica]NHO66436.1 endonuclease/exonuclease/phosphatase family protein [Aestuariicella hydrocarbonica]